MAEIENMKPGTKPAPKKVVQGEKLRGADKVARIPIKVIPTVEMPRKPDWIRVSLGNNEKVEKIRATLRKHKLSSVCEEASCPNLGECFSGGTATFMIMGDICTRRCPFCDVAHGRPNSLMENEPLELAEAIAEMGLKYVVVTSVDRDDLRDGGADHFARCISETRRLNPEIKVEILVPDFRGRGEVAVEILAKTKPDVFNHNLETVQSLYKKVRPGSDYQWSLNLLKNYKQIAPDVLTKSGIMVGVGETKEEVIQVLEDMHAHDIDMVTIGQYLQPSRDHLPVERFVHPDEFDEYARIGEEMGFHHVASGPLVRSSYHADQQSKL
jgi:lipoic acid synthetase